MNLSGGTRAPLEPSCTGVFNRRAYESACAGQRTACGKDSELTKQSGGSPDCRTSRIPDFLGSPVQSGFCLSGTWTETETGPPKSQ